MPPSTTERGLDKLLRHCLSARTPRLSSLGRLRADRNPPFRLARVNRYEPSVRRYDEYPAIAPEIAGWLQVVIEKSPDLKPNCEFDFLRLPQMPAQRCKGFGFRAVTRPFHPSLQSVIRQEPDNANRFFKSSSSFAHADLPNSGATERIL